MDLIQLNKFLIKIIENSLTMSKHVFLSYLTEVSKKLYLNGMPQLSQNLRILRDKHTKLIVGTPKYKLVEETNIETNSNKQVFIILQNIIWKLNEENHLIKEKLKFLLKINNKEIIKDALKEFKRN